MVKDFVFIEEGSLDQYNMLKLLENSGLTNDNVIKYKQGSPKPELVSVDITGKEIEKEDIQSLVNKAENNILTALEEFLYEYTEKSGEEYFDNQLCRFVTYHTLTVKGNVNDFMNNFKDYLSNKDEK